MFDTFNNIYVLGGKEFRRVLWKYPLDILWEFKIESCLIKEHIGLSKSRQNLGKNNTHQTNTWLCVILTSHKGKE